MGYANRQLRRRRTRRNWLILELVCLLILAVLTAMIAQKLIARRRIAAEEAASGQAMQTAAEPAPSAAPVISLSMRALQEQNPDAVGMLRFDGDRSFYVCQAGDNVYYMNHRFDGSEDPAGMIYMDYRCTLLPRSDNLILYGHNMADGSRFGTLKRFRSEKHLKENPIFTFAGLYETSDYTPVSIFTTSVLPGDPSYFAFDRAEFASAADFDAYIAEIKTRSEIDLPAVPVYGEKLLTLATCSSDHDRGRLVIVCCEAQPGEA